MDSRRASQGKNRKLKNATEEGAEYAVKAGAHRITTGSRLLHWEKKKNKATETREKKLYSKKKVGVICLTHPGRTGKTNGLDRWETKKKKTTKKIRTRRGKNAKSP